MNHLWNLARHSLAGLRVLVLLTVLLGLGYPLLVTGIATLALPGQAAGSYVAADGRPVDDPADAVGSSLLGQLAPDDLFQPRPSAAGEGYDPLNTYGSNLGPESPELVTAIEERKAEIAAREGVAESAVPPDAVTTSASGLDPHISPAYAAIQVPRVAEAHGLDEDKVRALVRAHTEGRSLGFLGEPRVNVLELNLAVLAAVRSGR